MYARESRAIHYTATRETLKINDTKIGGIAEKPYLCHALPVNTRKRARDSTGCHAGTDTPITSHKGTKHSSTMKQQLCLMAHDEVYIIDLQQVLYMQADDHYAHVHFASGGHMMLPYGLARIEQALNETAPEGARLKRFGRKYIVNLKRVCRINTTKEQLFLSDNTGNNICLHIPKNLLRDLISDIKNEGVAFFTK